MHLQLLTIEVTSAGVVTLRPLPGQQAPVAAAVTAAAASDDVCLVSATGALRVWRHGEWWPEASALEAGVLHVSAGPTHSLVVTAAQLLAVGRSGALRPLQPHQTPQVPLSRPGHAPQSPTATTPPSLGQRVPRRG